jgi:hypothetical protein
MKTIFSIAILSLLVQLIIGIKASYSWNNEYLSYWELADRSSSLPAKTEHISTFITKLENSNSASHNAIFLTTPANSFQGNLDALKTLLVRLKEIQGMDPTSFQYNTAIQQITAQEQGEAQEIIKTLRGCYMKGNYFIVWNWVGGLLCAIGFIVLSITGFCVFELYNKL